MSAERDCGTVIDNLLMNLPTSSTTSISPLGITDLVR